MARSPLRTTLHLPLDHAARDGGQSLILRARHCSGRARFVGVHLGVTLRGPTHGGPDRRSRGLRRRARSGGSWLRKSTNGEKRRLVRATWVGVRISELRYPLVLQHGYGTRGATDRRPRARSPADHGTRHDVSSPRARRPAQAVCGSWPSLSGVGHRRKTRRRPSRSLARACSGRAGQTSPPHHCRAACRRESGDRLAPSVRPARLVLAVATRVKDQ